MRQSYMLGGRVVADLSSGLAARDVAVVSGGAYGIVEWQTGRRWHPTV